MLITTGEPRTLGLEHDSWLRFGEVEPGVRRPPTGDRYLVVEDQAAFELSYWTGTCEFLFTRLWGANQTGSIEELQATLSAGLTRVEDRVIERFGALLPQDDYLPLLQRIEPRIIWPGKGDDYFTNECLDTWEIDAFWGLPHHPATPYHRTFETNVVDGTEPVGTWGDGHLYEFVVPMVPPRWNDRDRVTHFAEALATTEAPTAVAVSILDVCQPADGGDDYYAHWCLTHFLLDGHHKLEAAATTGRPLRLLSLLATESSLATPAQIARVPSLLSQPRAKRARPGD